MIRVAVFSSGGGSNLQALIDRLNPRADAPAHVVLVISDHPDAGALARAVAAGLEERVIPVRGRDPHEVADATLGVLRGADVGLVALAGYLQLVPAQLVSAYRGRIVNIHPALLPAFGGRGMYGMRVHRAVLEAGCTITGVTVHHVVERYDEGRPIVQWPVPVVRGDTPESLAKRVLAVEHVVYPLTIEWLARHVAEGAGEAATGFTSAAASASFALTRRDLEAEIRRALGTEEGTGP